MKKIRNYSEANTALLEFRRPLNTGNYTLKTMKRFMNSIGNPQDAMNVIHVAGTSGKTSTTYYIDSILRKSGYKVGMTVSPHIDVVSERAQIDGQPLNEQDYCTELSEFLMLVKESGESLSYFELLVAFAYWEFARKGVDYAVVEVGLGGLLDGTNVVTRSSKISVITDIGMDHVEILGDTLSKIAAQKAGIILPNSHVFVQHQAEEVIDVVHTIAHKKHATVHIVDQNDILLYPVDLPPFQERNLMLAMNVCNYVINSNSIDTLIDSDILNFAASITIPARMESFSWRGHDVVLDGSHNTQKIAALVAGMKSQKGMKSVPVLASFGVNKQIDIKNILCELHKITDDIILTEFSLGQDEIRPALSAEMLSQVCKELNFKKTTVIKNPVKAFEALMMKENYTVLVTGSYFLLNHIRPILNSKTLAR